MNSEQWNLDQMDISASLCGLQANVEQTVDSSLFAISIQKLKLNTLLIILFIYHSFALCWQTTIFFLYTNRKNNVSFFLKTFWL